MGSKRGTLKHLSNLPPGPELDRLTLAKIKAKLDSIINRLPTDVARERHRIELALELLGLFSPTH